MMAPSRPDIYMPGQPDLLRRIKVDGVFLTAIVIARIWSRIEIRGADECWPWIAAGSPGYGVIRVGNKLLVVSRIMAHAAYGKPSKKKPYACHTCDNPPCCNPKHLFWGSMKDNLDDASAKGRCAVQRHPEIIRGERNGSAKLTEAQVADIYTSGESKRQAADRFRVSVSLVKAIRQGKNWRHVTVSLRRGKVECRNTWPFRNAHR